MDATCVSQNQTSLESKATWAILLPFAGKTTNGFPTSIGAYSTPRAMTPHRAPNSALPTFRHRETVGGLAPKTAPTLYSGANLVFPHGIRVRELPGLDLRRYGFAGRLPPFCV